MPLSGIVTISNVTVVVPAKLPTPDCHRRSTRACVVHVCRCSLCSVSAFSLHFTNARCYRSTCYGLVESAHCKRACVCRTDSECHRLVPVKLPFPVIMPSPCPRLCCLCHCVVCVRRGVFAVEFYNYAWRYCATCVGLVRNLLSCNQACVRRIDYKRDRFSPCEIAHACYRHRCRACVCVV